jgi:hypothetical protein
VKAFLIDPSQRTIDSVLAPENPSLEDIQNLLGFERVEGCVINSQWDTLYLEDEGLYNKGQSFFVLEHKADPIPGKALCLGTIIDTGELTSPWIHLDYLKRLITFVTPEEAYEHWEKTSYDFR